MYAAPNLSGWPVGRSKTPNKSAARHQKTLEPVALFPLPPRVTQYRPGLCQHGLAGSRHMLQSHNAVPSRTSITVEFVPISCRKNRGEQSAGKGAMRTPMAGGLRRAALAPLGERRCQSQRLATIGGMEKWRTEIERCLCPLCNGRKPADEYSRHQGLPGEVVDRGSSALECLHRSFGSHRETF